MAEAMSRDQRVVLGVAVLASFVSFLDVTVVNVVLPAISRDLGGGLSTQQWVVDAYLVTLGAFILVAGSMSDVLGRTLVLRIGLIGFGATSVAIAAAPTAEVLIVARALQGVAGALLVPSSLALITSTFRGTGQARAIGIWTGATTVAMLAGPLIGGVFVDTLSWRLVFLVNVPPIAVTLWLLARRSQPDHPRPGARVDIIGALLCAVGLGGVVFALIEQSERSWASPVIWVPALLGIMSFAGFLIRQRLTREPMMPLDLFRSRNFWAGNLTTMFVYAALSLNGFVLSVYLQQSAGLTATLAGLASLPSTLLTIALSSRAGALSGRFGPRLFMTLGPALMAVGALMLLWVQPEFDYGTQVLPAVLVFGLGVTTTVSPLTAAVLGAIDTERSGIASAVNNAVSRIAGLLAIAAASAVAGGALDIDGFHRIAVFTAVLMTLGAVTSLLGIRNDLSRRD